MNAATGSRAGARCEICTPLLVMMVLVSSSAPALADSAGDLLQEAINRYGLADFEGSLEVLDQASKATRDPKALGQIHMYQGMNYGELHRLPLAKAAFVTALTHDPAACPAAAGFKKHLVQLCQEARQKLRGSLAVTANLDGGKVSVDDKEVGRVPCEVRVPIGSHRVTVQMAGRKTYTIEVVIYPDKKTEVQAQLSPEPATTPSAPRQVEQPPPPSRRIWTWIAAGGAVVTAAIGGGLWAASESDYSEWKEINDDPQYDNRDTRLGELEDSIRAKEASAYAMFGLAGALAATSVVLFFVEGRPPSQEQQTQLSWGPVRVAPTIGTSSRVTLTFSF